MRTTKEHVNVKYQFKTAELLRFFFKMTTAELRNGKNHGHSEETVSIYEKENNWLYGSTKNLPNPFVFQHSLRQGIADLNMCIILVLLKHTEAECREGGKHTHTLRCPLGI